MWMVHAPHTPCSHDTRTPVSSSSSRRTSESRRRGSTAASCAVPLTVSRIVTAAGGWGRDGSGMGGAPAGGAPAGGAPAGGGPAVAPRRRYRSVAVRRRRLRDAEGEATLDGVEDAGCRRADDAGDLRQAPRDEFEQVLVGAEDGGREDVVAAGGDADEVD